MNHLSILRGLVLMSAAAILLLIRGGDRHTWALVLALALACSLLLGLTDWARTHEKAQQDASAKEWQDALLQQVAKAATEVSLVQLNERQGAMNLVLDRVEKTLSVGAKQIVEAVSLFQAEARKGEEERRLMWLKEVEAMNNRNQEALDGWREKMLQVLGDVLKVQKASLGSFVERVEGVSVVVTQATQAQIGQMEAVSKFTGMLVESGDRMSVLFDELGETRKREREAFEQMQTRSLEVANMAAQEQEKAWEHLLSQIKKCR